MPNSCSSFRTFSRSNCGRDKFLLPYNREKVDKRFGDAPAPLRWLSVSPPEAAAVTSASQLSGISILWPYLTVKQLKVHKQTSKDSVRTLERSPTRNSFMSADHFFNASGWEGFRITHPSEWLLVGKGRLAELTNGTRVWGLLENRAYGLTSIVSFGLVWFLRQGFLCVAVLKLTL